MDLTRLLQPRSVAVVGATERPGSYGGEALLNLRRFGFPGPVYGVNPNHSQVHGYPCAPTLADSAADAAAGRLLALQVARMVDAEADLKILHAKASMAKLFVSEAAHRCADRAVQVFGGRGYTRTNVAERFWRELRVDRIWEGTSEIQRLIIARALERRGVEAVLR